MNKQLNRRVLFFLGRVSGEGYDGAWLGRKGCQALETEAENLLGALGHDNVSQSWNKQHQDAFQINLKSKKKKIKAQQTLFQQYTLTVPDRRSWRLWVSCSPP